MNISRFLIDSKQPPEFQTQLKNVWSFAQTANLGDFSGDLLIQLDNKLLLVEVKSSPNDFVASITDRRLFHQSEGMKKITPWAFLIHPNFAYDKQGFVYSLWENGYGPHEHWNRTHIEGALTAVQARGVMTRPAQNGIVDTIRRLTRWADTADIGSVTTEGIKLSPFDEDDQETVNLLCWFKGIGVIQAKNFLSWVESKHGTRKLPRHQLLELALTPFDKNDKPVGWTSHTIESNRRQMQYPEPIKVRTEWKEEIDL